MAAWRCVAHEGFHKTTMADVVRESGLSVGAVYGYFRSKDEIIASVAEKLTRVRHSFEVLVRRMQEAGYVDADAPPEPVAQVLFGLMPGYILQRLILGDVSPESYADGLDGLLGVRLRSNDALRR